MKIAIGTAQFGSEYGGFNQAGKVAPIVVSDLLNLAISAGITTLDTASAYGVAEDVLGGLVGDRFDIVTKCPPLNGQPSMLLRAFNASEARLNCSIHGYLMHDPSDLLSVGGDKVWASLEELRDSGRVKKIGISAYSYEEAAEVAKRFPITIVQIPANVLVPWYITQQFDSTIEVHARSVFLQGFLLCDPDHLPNRFQQWKDTLIRFRSLCNSAGVSPLQAALSPVMASSAVDQVVVGVDSLPQLKSVIEAAIGSIVVPGLEELSGVSTNLSDPRRW